MEEKRLIRILLCLAVMILGLLTLLIYGSEHPYMSGIGDPGMKTDNLRVAIESWNQCNEVREEAPNMGSPRMADCFDVKHFFWNGEPSVDHKVEEWENRLGMKSNPHDMFETNRYAAWKELYLGTKCQVSNYHGPWQFWMIMLKNGNMDTTAAMCPNNGYKSEPFSQTPEFPCFGKGCMNMPSMYHNYTKGYGNRRLKGGFYGSWDLDVDAKEAIHMNDTSYYSVTWEKELLKGSWVFHNLLKTSSKYPWLMLYVRSDATKGFSAGYHYESRGMTVLVPKSPNFKVRFTLDIKQGGGPKSQFYLIDIGSCWKNNGEPCDGDVTSDVTRYSEMIINPEIEAWCKPDQLKQCPPYHTFANGTRVHRTNTTHFPYDAYHIYRAPGNAKYLEEPVKTSDPYSNPQPQEILQILPHPVWGEYGYPTKKGEGWVGDPRTWELDVGRLSQSLYFYQASLTKICRIIYLNMREFLNFGNDLFTCLMQDPGTVPVERNWTSINLGTEIYISEVGHVAEWTVSNFDILVPFSLG
ncbi:hypothetical protein PIB30_061370 [Stylosanthes scabra]|uniref:DUF7705 domain-containing protein n=1 Tax=Stylosanthes scabra TaxID=79078 RepID=A0ABU6VLT3_9FABA|nr:hypothetical protein [Stylosanthes scabra]